MEQLVLGLLSTIIGLWLGSIEYRFRNMETRLRKAVEMSEVEKIIDLKQEVLKAIQQEMKDDIKDMKGDLRVIREAVCPVK